MAAGSSCPVSPFPSEDGIDDDEDDDEND